MENFSDYQQYIAKSRYSRYLPDEQRRETWEETVRRYCDFFFNKYPQFPKDKVFEYIYNLKVMPSMRALMTAGPALDRDNAAGYNCSYMVIDNQRAFDEAMYLLMCGSGVGYSVERQFIVKLPTVSEEFFESDTVISVKDSKIGWASSFRELISLLYQGQIPKWDLTKLRPAGTPLKIFGGRSSGPGPLNELFEFAVYLFRNAAGRKLTSLECNDLMCKVGEIVVVGGVRRSACICLSNLSDDRMRNAKSGQWWVSDSQRALANISVAYTEKPSIGQFMEEWMSLYESKSGERGIFNRVAAVKKITELGRRDPDPIKENGGANPCGEIVLRSCEFCNLTEVVIRAEDSLDDILQKIEMATIIGTFQSMLTDFRYLRSSWKKNTEEERLLGVSLTGIMDHEVMSGQKGHGVLSEWLTALREKAIDINKEWSSLLGIQQSVAITTVKPSGTVSQLVDSASGIHPRYAKYYIRTVRNDKKDPLSQFLIDAGVPYEPDVTKPDSTLVFSFPMKSPNLAVTAKEVSAIEQLELYLTYSKFWSEHNISITVYLQENEWLKVGAWVYEHFNEINGISFLPYSDHSYRQAPYQPISEEKYNELAEKRVDIDWSKFTVKEHEDSTVGAKQYACSGGSCEII
mgnify:FL=1